MTDSNQPPRARGALGSVICGALGICCPLFILSIIAVVLGHSAKKTIASSDGEFGGDGSSTAGLVLGYCGIAFSCLAGVSILAGLLVPTITMVREKAYRTQCVNNMREVFKLASQYEDEQGRFPENMEILQQFSIDSGVPASVFICPSRDETDGPSYEFVGTGKKSDSGNPVLIQETAGSHMSLGGNVVHVDGRAVWREK